MREKVEIERWKFDIWSLSTRGYQSWCKFAENNIVIIIVVYIGSGNFATKQQLSM